MSPELINLLGVGVALAGLMLTVWLAARKFGRQQTSAMNVNVQGIVAALILAMLGWLIVDQRSLRGYVRTEITAIRSDIADLRERMARLEGQMDVAIEGLARSDER